MMRCVLAVLLLAVVAPARAQERSAESTEPAPGDAAEPEPLEQAPPSEEDRARDLFEQAVAAFDTGRYEEALEGFRRSFVLRPAPLVLYNIAVAERRLGHDLQAVRHLREYLAEAGEDDPRRGVIVGELEELERRLAQVSIEVDPPGAEIRVDGRSVGVAPLPAPVVLVPGSHRIEVEAPEHGPVSQVLELRAGERRRVHLELGSRDRAPARADGGRRPADLLALDASRDDPARDSAGSFWQSPWPWIVAGVLLAGAGAGLWLWVSDEPESLEGNFDPPVVHALRWP